MMRILLDKQNKNGTHVSGAKRATMTVSVPEKMASIPITHLHPAASPKKPPATGPMEGPRKGAAAKSDMARPRSLALNMLHYR